MNISKQELIKMINNERKLLISNNKIYDITNYFKNHPGGKCILKNIIKIKNNILIINDSSIDFNYHNKKSKDIWKKLFIGYYNKKKINLSPCTIC